MYNTWIFRKYGTYNNEFKDIFDVFNIFYVVSSSKNVVFINKNIKQSFNLYFVTFMFQKLVILCRFTFFYFKGFDGFDVRKIDDHEYTVEISCYFLTKWKDDRLVLSDTIMSKRRKRLNSNSSDAFASEIPHGGESIGSFCSHMVLSTSFLWAITLHYL